MSEELKGGNADFPHTKIAKTSVCALNIIIITYYTAEMKIEQFAVKLFNQNIHDARVLTALNWDNAYVFDEWRWVWVSWEFQGIFFESFLKWNFTAKKNHTHVLGKMIKEM